MPTDLSDPQLDAIHSIYPELLLIPLLKAPKLLNAWKAWLERRDTTWTLGKFKSETRWGNQLKDRDWTPDQITDTLKYGRKYPAPNKLNPNNPAIRYQWREKFIVRDETTKEILQISRKDFNPNIMKD